MATKAKSVRSEDPPVYAYPEQCKAQAEDRILAQAYEIMDRRLGLLDLRVESIGAPAELVAHIQRRLGAVEHEVFYVVYLDARHRIITGEALFRGGLTGAAVYVGEVAKAALRHGAAAMIIAHNHPSGIAEPSAADRELTERLRQALVMLEIRLLDHVVIGGRDHVSFAMRGWL